jgi:serine/threonine protein kinase
VGGVVVDSVSRPPPDNGSRVGRFVVTSVLGAGAFGTVYLGPDPSTGSAVAVKVMAREYQDSTMFRTALRAEEAALRRIRDQHCVRVVDIVDEPDVVAIVTELVDGASLRAVLARAGRLTGPQSLDVLRGTLLGLSAVRAAGLVHGDIKPDIMLSNNLF